MTKTERELIPDPRIYIFFEKGTTSAISYISKIYSNTNIKYWKSYYRKQESNHIMYLDANNLYGFEISKFLPRSGRKWIDPKELDLKTYTKRK